MPAHHTAANDRADTALRVIADHCRATAFLVADGVLPANEGRGYVLRRIMRRAIRFGRSLGLTRPFLSTITSKVVEEMSPAYPHLHDAAKLLEQVVNNEEERFLETLGNGLEMLGKEIHRLKKEKIKIIDGEFIFKLYDTFGFPVDIVRDVSIEEGYGIDEAGYHKAMEVAEGPIPQILEGRRTGGTRRRAAPARHQRGKKPLCRLHRPAAAISPCRHHQ